MISGRVLTTVRTLSLLYFLFHCVSQYFKQRYTVFYSEEHSGLNFFEVSILVVYIKMFVDPEYRVKLFIADIGDIVRVPDGHIDK